MAGLFPRSALAAALCAILAIAGCVPVGPVTVVQPGAMRPNAVTVPQTAGNRSSGVTFVGGPLAAAYNSSRPPTAEASGQGAELAFARQVLSEVQVISIRQNREYCGYIGLNAANQLISTPPVAGNEASCLLPDVPAGMTLLASFHTHSTYSPIYASEWPTTQDMRSDQQNGIDGYISTPGGRLWYTDTDTMTVREICGRGCLPQDPNYRAQADGPLQPVMSFDRLQRFENGLL
jgi:hypothetical protein